jgi:hypothetical protein
LLLLLLVLLHASAAIAEATHVQALHIANAAWDEVNLVVAGIHIPQHSKAKQRIWQGLQAIVTDCQHLQAPVTKGKAPPQQSAPVAFTSQHTAGMSSKHT